MAALTDRRLPRTVGIHKLSLSLPLSRAEARSGRARIASREEIPFHNRSRNSHHSPDNMAPAIDIPQPVEWQGKKVPVWFMQTIDYGLLLSQDTGVVVLVFLVCLL